MCNLLWSNPVYSSANSIMYQKSFSKEWKIVSRSLSLCTVLSWRVKHVYMVIHGTIKWSLLCTYTISKQNALVPNFLKLLCICAMFPCILSSSYDASISTTIPFLATPPIIDSFITFWGYILSRLYILMLATPLENCRLLVVFMVESQIHDSFLASLSLSIEFQ